MIPAMPADGYVRAARLAALKDAKALAAAIDALQEPLDQIAATLRFHYVASLVRASLDSGSADGRFDALFDAIDRLRPLPFPTAAECRIGFDEVRTRLGAIGNRCAAPEGSVLRRAPVRWHAVAAAVRRRRPDTGSVPT